MPTDALVLVAAVCASLETLDYSLQRLLSKNCERLLRYGKTDLRVVKDHRRPSRVAPPMRAGHKDLTAVMNRFFLEGGRFIDLSIENATLGTPAGADSE